MSPDYQIATLVEQNEQCEKERDALRERVENLMGAYNQVKGMFRVLVVLWTILTAAVSAGAAKVWHHVDNPPATLK